MTIQQKVRTLISDSRVRAGNLFRSTASTQKKRASLLTRVERGQLVQELLRSDVWLKVLQPCLAKTRHKANFHLKNDHSPYGEKDVQRYYPRGVIDTVDEILGDTEVKSMLEKIIEQAHVARKELSLLQKEETEQDDAQR